MHLIWGERPAATARTQVQICVSRIRVDRDYARARSFASQMRVGAA